MVVSKFCLVIEKNFCMKLIARSASPSDKHQGICQGLHLLDSIHITSVHTVTQGVDLGVKLFDLLGSCGLVNTKP